jgi:tRNA(Ile2) C34 agmatinyltransferase TiaS
LPGCRQRTFAANRRAKLRCHSCGLGARNARLRHLPRPAQSWRNLFHSS